MTTSLAAPAPGASKPHLLTTEPGLVDEALPLLEPDDELSNAVVVIGAGIIGLSIAWQLRQRGHAVLLLERSEVAAGASRGNAGAYAFSDILPLASPGIVAQLPRWLMDPLGPLTLRPSYLPRIAPWLWQFWRASRPAAFAAGLRAQAELMRLAGPATQRLLHSLGAGDMVRHDGNLHLYESRAEWQAALAGWQLRAQHGIVFEHLHGADAIAALQPGLAPRLVAATFVPNWQTITDPYQLALLLAQRLRQAGARLCRAQVLALRPEPQGMRLSLLGGGGVLAQRVVLAAGAWSQQLAATMGEHFPLETERGYNTTLPVGAFALKRQLTFPNHGFVMTPIAGGVRVGGAVELAGLKAAPNYRRAAALLTKAQRFVPGLNPEGGTQWMGFRPSLPDSLPAIGPAPRDARLICAFGHGHLGLTQSAASAELVADLLEGKTPALDLKPFSPGRFGA